jgi:hypothetical protein
VFAPRKEIEKREIKIIRGLLLFLACQLVYNPDYLKNKDAIYQEK